MAISKPFEVDIGENGFVDYAASSCMIILLVMARRRWGCHGRRACRIETLSMPWFGESQGLQVRPHLEGGIRK